MGGSISSNDQPEEEFAHQRQRRSSRKVNRNEVLEEKHLDDQQQEAARPTGEHHKAIWEKNSTSLGDMPEATKNHTKRLFKRLDKDKDGWITIHDVLKGLKSLGHSVHESTVKEIIEDNEVRIKNNKVQLQGFLIVVAKVKPDDGATILELQDVFKKLDQDHDGYISARDLRTAQINGIKYTDEEIQDLIELTDTDGDGKISFNEFANMIGK